MAWLTGWSYRKKLTLDSSKVDSDCSDFPVKVIFDKDNFDFAKALSMGNDIRFTSSDGETLLKYERELHQTADTPTGYANATYETSFNGSDEYYSLPSAANLHKPYQVLEVEFTANAVNKDQNIVYLEMADRTGASWFSLVKVRSIRLSITSEGKLFGHMGCSNTGTSANASVTSSASLSADTKYSAKLVIDNNTKSLELYLDGQLQGRNTVTHAQTWSDISAYIWCDLGFFYDFHCTTSTNHSLYFDGTIHSYNLMAQNTLTSAVYHVKLPTASSTSDTEFYVYYGKSDASDGADGENVWDSNYALVHHMGADCLDSTSNDNDGTNSGSTLGLAGDGYYRTFAGDHTQYITVADDATLRVQAHTIEGLVKPTTVSKWNHILDKTGDLNHTYGYRFTITDANYVRCRYRDTSDGLHAVISDGTVSANTVQHVAGTYDTSDLKVYIDGALSKTESATGTIKYDASGLYLGFPLNTNSAQALTGNMYEVRISNIARSDAWIKATYHSLADTLLTYGAEEALTPTARPRVMVVWA